MLTHYGFFQVQICRHTITRKATVRRATKICRHNYTLVKIGTTSTADSLVEILRNKYRTEESKDKQVTSVKLQEKKIKEEKKRGDR
jgi:ribose 5-phosphate isomerase